MPSRRKPSILLDPALENEITEAIRAHAAWKVRLASAIETGEVDLNVADVRKDNLCAFGRWLYGLTIPKAVHLEPNYIMVRQIHANFHECAGRVLELILEGKKAQADAMMAPAGEYTQISEQLVVAMTKWKRTIAKQGGDRIPGY